MNSSLPLQTRQTLKALGFLENEIKILLLLFQQRKLTTKEISQQTTISFDAVHYSLHGLEKRKLVTRKSQKGEDAVEICSDKEFLQWIEAQKQRNGEVYDDAKSVIHGFLTAVQESAWKPNVIYFEGVQGVIDIYEDMIEKGKDIYCWTDIQKIHETLGEYMQEFIKKRIEKGITSYAIMPRYGMNKEYAENDQMRDVKFSDNLPIDGEIRIYDDRVAVITFHDKKPVGFIFSGSVITSVFRGIFDHAWNGCK